MSVITGHSIRRRLIIYLSISMVVIWGVLVGLSIHFISHEVNEANDTQMSQLARFLINGHVYTRESIIVRDLADSVPDDTEGASEDDDMGFVLWSSEGQIVIADQIGSQLSFHPTREGFSNNGAWWDEDALRVLTLRADDGNTIAAVAQPWEERLELIRGALLPQLIMIFTVFPVMLLVILWSVTKGLQPLATLSSELNHRRGEDLSAIPEQEDLPRELQPLVTALNQLFERINATFAREQRFTADAAHELRSPLAAIKAQADALRLIGVNEAAHPHIDRIGKATERAAYMIDQLLILARVDALATLENTQPINWQTVSDMALSSVSLLAREQRVSLRRELGTTTPVSWRLQGDETLLTIMLRNLLDNAVRHGKPNTEVMLTITDHDLTVRDHGAGVDPAQIDKMRERFFRAAPPAKRGTGLGLSIAEQICIIHGLQMEIRNHPDGGLQVRVFPKAS